MRAPSRDRLARDGMYEDGGQGKDRSAAQRAVLN